VKGPGYLLLENEETAGDADNKHHQPGSQSEPEVYLMNIIFERPALSHIV
jgi:hypothetical protein